MEQSTKESYYPQDEKSRKVISDAFINSEHPAVEKIYVDFECLQDFNIGALLTMISTEVEYQYILHQLPIYEKALDRRVAKYFPALNFTDEQIEARKIDPAYADRIMIGSPMTNLFYTTPELFSLHLSNNEFHDKKFDMQLYINTETVKLTDIAKRKWAVWALDLIPGVTVNYSTDGYRKKTPKFFSSMDLLILNNVKELFHWEEVCNDLVSKELYFFKTIWARKQAEDEIIEKHMEDIDIVLDGSSRTFNLVTRFQFFDHVIAKSE